MYVKRIQIQNYGPIDILDIEFPFTDDKPKPVLLVGENGSGKSVLLSHIVNGLVHAKGIGYPDTPEVDTGRMFKLRSPSYVKSEKEFSAVRVDYESQLYMEELVTRRIKREYQNIPQPLSIWGGRLWERLEDNDFDIMMTNMRDNSAQIKEAFSKNCALYFPHNRFEEPAWLNEKNLRFQAQLADGNHYVNSTNRNIISYSPLRSNQNWFFEIAYDRGVGIGMFELPPLEIEGKPIPRLFAQYSDDATNAVNAVLIAEEIVRTITGLSDVQFNIGNRWDRAVTFVSLTEGRVIVPNVFQMSSGETSLLNIFLSILRDYDMCEIAISSAADIRGIVVVDEIDLHLHAKHQHEILPKLVKMFPKVQFVVTTHSPLFVLGMNKIFDDDGFAIYSLPEGQPISPEEFGEFGAAYQAFQQYNEHIRGEIEMAQNPLVFVEGKTDVKYITKAAEFLGKVELLARIELKEGGGSANLSKIWNASRPLSELDKKILLIYDCDANKIDSRSGKVFQRIIPKQEIQTHPVQKGIENLFSQETLSRAIEQDKSFATIYFGGKKVDGKEEYEPERWEINNDKKAKLCNWICENGTLEDFRGFEVVFKIIEDALFPTAEDEM